jgi:acyl carrier protein
MKERLVQILSDVLGVPVQEIPADASMASIAQWDSIAHLNVVLTLEQEFHVQFSGEEFMALDSLPAMEQALAKRGVA